jgi:hypothetical protein
MDVAREVTEFIKGKGKTSQEAMERPHLAKGLGEADWLEAEKGVSLWEEKDLGSSRAPIISEWRGI